MDPMAISIGVGVVVIVLMLGIFALASRSNDELAEQRLDDLTSSRKPKVDLSQGMLLRPPSLNLGDASFWNKLVPSPEALEQLCEQADVNLDVNKFMGLVVVLAVAGGVAGYFMQISLLLVPIGAAAMASLPFLWLHHRKASRMQKFLDAMPESMELMGRALRAGHGLASGMRLVADEMKGPIAVEFGRVFEEQNLGIPIEISLRNMAERVPSMDVRFFVTAVVIQRATGGDLAEVLDKISRLIRQRFELHGHVKALTAEGRLSGLVLLALPPGLLAFLSFSNYNYISVLFTTEQGTKMLAVTAVLQVIGALAIKKIVAIKV